MPVSVSWLHTLPPSCSRSLAGVCERVVSPSYGSLVLCFRLRTVVFSHLYTLALRVYPFFFELETLSLSSRSSRDLSPGHLSKE